MAATDGDLIKMNGLSSVYYLKGGKRFVFPNESTYFSWYSDFNSVKTIAQSELESYPLGGNVTIRPGTKLVKITTNPTVYAVEPGGTLRAIASEAAAMDLYGAMWNKIIVDVADSFFVNYTVGTTLTAGVFPVGQIVNPAGSMDLFYWDGTNFRKFSNESAFLANGFDYKFVVTTTKTVTAGGTAIVGAEAALMNTAGGVNNGNGTPVGGSALTVALAGNTAASNTVLQNQSIANMATFNFTASSDGASIVKTVKIKRTGISSDTALSNVYLYDGSTKLTDAGSISAGYVTFSDNSGLFTVAAGATKAITVKADIAANTGNVGVSINAASDIIANGATISGTFPMTGNLMSMTSVTDLATAVAGTVASSGNINAGTMGVTLWSDTFTISQRDVKLTDVNFRQIGSIAKDDIQNMNLYVDGVKVGTALASLSDTNRAHFDLSATPATLQTGNRTVELRGDIIKGSNKTFSFSLQTASDISFVDSNYGVNISATGLPQTTTSATINNGSLVITADPTFSTTQVMKNQSNVTFAKYTFKAYGEDMKITTLNADVLLTGATGATTTAATDGINNLAIFVDGAQVGSSQNALQTVTGNNFNPVKTYGTTNLFTVKAGATATVEIRGTLVMNSGSTTVTTATSKLVSVSGAFQGLTSYNTSGGASYATKTLTIVSSGYSSVSLNNAYATNQTQVNNVLKQKIGSFTISAGTLEGITVTNIAINFPVSASNNSMATTTFASNVSNMYISEAPNSPVGNPSITTANVTNFPVNFTLAVGQSKVIDVFADIASMTTAETLTPSMAITARTATTNLVADVTATAGQKITYTSGTLANPTKVANLSINKLVTGGTTDNVGVFNFVATNGAATIKSLRFFVDDATSISSITVGGATAPIVNLGGGQYGALFNEALNIVVPVGSTGLNVPVTAAYNAIGTNAGTTRVSPTVSIDGMSYQIGNAAPSTFSSGLAIAGMTNVVVASVPTVTLAAVAGGGVLNASNQEVMRLQVTAPSSGPINLKQFMVLATITGVTTSTVTSVYDIENPSVNLLTGGTPVSLTNASTSTLTFGSDFLIPASTTKTFGVKMSGTLAGGQNTNHFTLSLAAPNDTAKSTGDNWKWNDTTAATYGNAYLLKDLTAAGTTFSQ